VLKLDEYICRHFLADVQLDLQGLEDTGGEFGLAFAELVVFQLVVFETADVAVVAHVAFSAVEVYVYQRFAVLAANYYLGVRLL
jgi:hypothetical protein